MAAPTFVAHYQPAGGITTGASRTVSVTTAVGDRLVCHGLSPDSTVTLATPTGGTGLTWTLQASVTGVSSRGNVYIWTATATTAETFTASVAKTGDSTAKWHYGVTRWSGASGFAGANAANAANGLPSVNVATGSDNAAIVVANVDWDRTDGSTRTWRTNAGALTELLYQQTAAGFGQTGYAGYHADAGAAGTYAVGLTVPTGQTYSIAAIAVLGADVAKSGSDTIGFPLTDNATVTERGKAGSDTVGFPLTDNATVLTPVPKSGSDTIGFPLTDNAAAPDKSTIKAGSDTVGFPLTDNATKQSIGPTSGTWTSPPVPLTDQQIAGSIIYWQATVPSGTALVVQTSTDNGGSWQVAVNKGPIPSLPIGTRSAQAVLARAVLSRSLPELASPQLHRLELRVAIDSSRDELCQLGRFMLQDTEVVDSPSGLVLRLVGTDLSRRIARNTWDESLVIDEATNGRDAVMTLVANRWPDATFNLPSTEFSCTRLFYGPGVGSGNPWTDARTLARDVCGWDLHLDAYGVVTGRPIPDPNVQPSVHTFEDSSRPTIAELSRRMTDENTYNQVIVIGQSTSNDEAVSATWRDTDPASKTRVDGPYGVVTKTIRSEKVRTAEQAQVVADAEGARIKGATELVRVRALPVPFLEPWDVVEVDRTRSKTTGRFLLDGWHYPLGVDDLMDMTCRRQRQ